MSLEMRDEPTVVYVFYDMYVSPAAKEENMPVSVRTRW